MRRIGLLGTAVAAVATSVLTGQLLSTPVAAADDGKDFIADARLYYRVIACAGTDALPAGFDAKLVDEHCKEMVKREARYRSEFGDVARAFFAPLQPASLPTTVVYPFGGGDLGSALVTFPRATDITTMSLEHAGDITRLAGIDGKKLKKRLAEFRGAVGGLLSLNDSTSDNMQLLERNEIPGQLSFFITALAALGYEPVSLRFFDLQPDGSIHYLTGADIDKVKTEFARKKKGSWEDPDFSVAYSNSELRFRKAGDAKAAIITHRHIAANLADEKFKGSPLQKFLVAKGKVAAMTKAATYLLWQSAFSGVRDYLVQNMVWMASDSTGLLPKDARKGGFKQTTYGTFKGAFLPEMGAGQDGMIALWASQPSRKLPFRYGYPDSERHLHLMITEPAR